MNIISDIAIAKADIEHEQIVYGMCSKPVSQNHNCAPLKNIKGMANLFACLSCKRHCYQN